MIDEEPRCEDRAAPCCSRSALRPDATLAELVGLAASEAQRHTLNFSQLGALVATLVHELHVCTLNGVRLHLLAVREILGSPEKKEEAQDRSPPQNSGVGVFEVQ